MKRMPYFLTSTLSAVLLLTSCNIDSSSSIKTSVNLGSDSSESSKITSTADRYYVPPEVAKSLLDSLIKNGDIQRPALDTIASFNGGTAKDESKENPHLSCFADEQQYEQIKIALINKWRSAWMNKNISKFESLFASNGNTKIYPTKFLHEANKLNDRITQQKWTDAKVGSAKDYLSSFKELVDVDLVTFKMYAPRSYRNDKLEIEKAELQVFLDVRGFDHNSNRRNDRGMLKVSVAKQDGDWKITHVKNWSVESLVSTKPAFEEVTKISKVDQIPQYKRLEAIRRGGYAVAVGDYNNDKINDIYVGAHGAGKLLTGNKDGTFTEFKTSGLNNETLVKTAVFADFDNDQYKDLLLVRFSGYTRVEKDNLRTDLILYKNMNGKSFKRVGKILGDTVLNETAMPAAVADYNNDGLLDFYIGYPGNKDFTVLGKITGRDKIKEQGVYINKGDFKFLTKDRMVDYKDPKFKNVTRHQQVFPHSSVAFDFDQDGDVDIVVIDDRGNISPAYMNDGNGNFTQAERHIGVMNKGFGMGLAAGDIDNDGRIDMVLTNVNFNAKYRLDQSCRANWDDEVFEQFDHGLKFYKGLKKGVFSEATGKLGLDYAGEGLAGAEFIDYDNDGYQDLYVANGLWSGTDRDEDISSLFARTYLAKEDRIIRSHRGARPQSDIMNVLAGYKGSIVGKDKKSRLSFAGFQRNRLFRNNGDGSFTEVGFLEGVDSIADGYVISKSDYNDNGSVDLILRNGDPGTSEVSFEPIQIFKNNSGGNSLRVELIGTRSNRDGVGAEVSIKVGDKKMIQQAIANNGTAQSEKIIHFGLGSSRVVDELVVKWPSGVKTVVKNIKNRKITIKERAARDVAKR